MCRYLIVFDNWGLDLEYKNTYGRTASNAATAPYTTLAAAACATTTAACEANSSRSSTTTTTARTVSGTDAASTEGGNVIAIGSHGTRPGPSGATVSTITSSPATAITHSTRAYFIPNAATRSTASLAVLRNKPSTTISAIATV